MDAPFPWALRNIHCTCDWLLILLERAPPLTEVIYLPHCSTSLPAAGKAFSILVEWINEWANESYAILFLKHRGFKRPLKSAFECQKVPGSSLTLLFQTSWSVQSPIGSLSPESGLQLLLPDSCVGLSAWLVAQVLFFWSCFSDHLQKYLGPSRSLYFPTWPAVCTLTFPGRNKNIYCWTTAPA